MSTVVELAMWSRTLYLSLSLSHLGCGHDEVEEEQSSHWRGLTCVGVRWMSAGDATQWMFCAWAQVPYSGDRQAGRQTGAEVGGHTYI